MAGKERKSRFQPGGTGACEAQLFAFSTRQAGTQQPALHFVAACGLEEAVQHMRLSYPAFDIGRIELLGVVEMISGFPLD